MEGRTLEEVTEARAVPKIAAALADDIVAVHELRPHPENPRRGNINAIAASLDRFGQVKPVLALPDGTLVAGHHVYYAARHLGWDRIAAVRVALNDDDTRAYLLADNRISELGTYDSDALGRLLIEVDGSDIGLEGTGYRPEELKRFLSLLDADPADRADQVRCPRCGAHVKA
jgi:ParB-like chromosome segregation protein Spo0J